MEQSILKSTKKVLQIGLDDDSFDLDVITQVNSAFSTLNDLGVGPDIGFVIEDDTPEWSDFLPDLEDQAQLNQIKEFVQLRARLGFDPPSSSYLLDSATRRLDELTSRISMRRENTEWVDPAPPDLLIVDGGDPSGEV